MISSVPKVSQDIISKFCELSVGRVFSSDTCIGSCAAVITYNNRSLIITCYHIVYDEYLDGVPLYKLSFSFNDKKYTQHDISYLGSSKRFDISIFEMKNGFVASIGYHLSTADCYENERIYLACFPLATTTDIANHTTSLVSPTLFEGIVTAAEVIYDTALVDISSHIPNSSTFSGGALFSQLFDYTRLLGIYIEAVCHENIMNDNEPSTTTNKASVTYDDDVSPVSYILKSDDALYDPTPVGPDAGEVPSVGLSPTDTEEVGLASAQSYPPPDQSDSPPDQSTDITHEQSLYKNNVKNTSFSFSSAYFITTATLIKLLSGTGALMRPELKGDNKTPKKKRRRRSG